MFLRALTTRATPCGLGPRISKTLEKKGTRPATTGAWQERVMSVRVLLPNAFQKHTNNVREISSTAANLPELVTDIEGRFPALRQHLRGEDGQIRRFINFYVNEEDIRFLGNDKRSE